MSSGIEFQAVATSSGWIQKPTLPTTKFISARRFSMNFFRKLSMAALGLSVVAALATAPANAQAAAQGDIFQSGANAGQAQNNGGNTLSQSNANAGANTAQAPS